MAIAMTDTDKGISTIQYSAFNTDLEKHTSIDVEYARSLIDFNVRTEPICRPSGEVVPDIYNLVREDTDTVLPIGRSVGREFHPIQHSTLFDFLVKDILPQVPQMELETVATMYGGSTSFVMAHFGEDFRLPFDQSKMYSSLIFSNPLGRGSVVLGFCWTRAVCMNTYKKAVKEAKNCELGFKIQHSTNGGRLVEVALQSIKKEIDSAVELREKMNFLAQKDASPAMVESFLDMVIPLGEKKEGRSLTMAKNVRDEIVRQFESGETAQTMERKTMWSLLNSATYRVFNPQKTTSRNDGAEIAYSGMMGTRSDKVGGMFEAAMEVAKAA